MDKVVFSVDVCIIVLTSMGCMGVGMDLGFVWAEDKYEKVVADHNVRFYEVVSAFDDQDGYEVPDPAGHADRWMWVGKTVHDRVLIVIYSEEELPLYRLITTFDAEGKWLNEYNQRHRV